MMVVAEVLIIILAGHSVQREQDLVRELGVAFYLLCRARVDAARDGGRLA